VLILERLNFWLKINVESIQKISIYRLFIFPESIIKRIPGIVIEVSAIFVEKTTLREPHKINNC